MGLLTSVFRLINKSLRIKRGSNSNMKELFGDSNNINISMTSLMDDIHHSKTLYDELKVKIHPDRFINTSKYDLSVTLFQELTLNKRNYTKLLELKNTAEEKLF